MGSFLSDAMTTSTGSPQGCVLSPLLFILYTNSCTSTLQNRHFIKYKDDTALVSLLWDEKVDHGPVLDSFLEWCNKSHLISNTNKTKEMSIDFRKSQQSTDTFINGETIQVVTNYKYLGIALDNKLKWDSWSNLLHTKTQQRMYFLKLFLMSITKCSKCFILHLLKVF